MGDEDKFALAEKRYIEVAYTRKRQAEVVR